MKLRMPWGLAALGSTAALLAACGTSTGPVRPAATSSGSPTVTASAGGVFTDPPLADTAYSPSATVSIPHGDWPTFDFTAQHTGVGPADTGISARSLAALRHRTVPLDGTVDASVIEVAGVHILGHRRDVIVLTTDYGRTEALDAATGRRLWEFAPPTVNSLQGTYRVTTATPVLDPSRRAVYAASPDGYVRKLALSTGRVLWRTGVTRDPSKEKIASALTIDGPELIVVTNGYDGDYPKYDGHVSAIDLGSGRIAHVFNSLCSNLGGIIAPSACGSSDSGIWGRPGAIVLPGSHDLLVTTANGDFNGRTDWADSVLELSPSLTLLHNWTPANEHQLNVDDTDLGSTEPTLLPVRGHVAYAVQAGKSGVISLIDLHRLNGTTGGAGPRLGGEVQTIDAPGPTDVFSQPAVWHSLVFVADGAGTAAYRFGSDNRLHPAWHNGNAGTSPVVAGGLLYVYNEQGGTLDVYDPGSGHEYAALSAGGGHWNSPTVIGGRIFLPVGNDNDHQRTGTLNIWELRR